MLARYTFEFERESYGYCEDTQEEYFEYEEFEYDLDQEEFDNFMAKLFAEVHKIPFEQAKEIMETYDLQDSFYEENMDLVDNAIEEEFRDKAYKEYLEELEWRESTLFFILFLEQRSPAVTVLSDPRSCAAPAQKNFFSLF